MSKRIFLILAFSLLTVQSALAQTAEQSLERIAIHTRLMESKLETSKVGSQFQGDLRRLVADLENWKSSFLDEDDINDVRERLDDHKHMLEASVLMVSLDSDQSSTLELLFSEIERGSQNLVPDTFAQTRTIRIPYQLPSGDTQEASNARQWGVSWDNPAGWGGWLESCQPGGIDPWAPYFGRDINRNSGPMWW